ncbi:MAG TPA: hypothetical protein VKT52_12520 [Ktedonobacterales bacterium]|nr:hypothetical protein [Ktedonobacterales bacterium]
MSPAKRHAESGLFINVRKLVAFDIALHGMPFILIEFSLTVIGGAALGLFILLRTVFASGTISILGLVVGAYVLAIAVNYAPLLLYALAIRSRARAREEVGAELDDREERGWYARRYGTQQLLLVVPLFIPLLAITQELRKRTHAQ